MKRRVSPELRSQLVPRVLNRVAALGADAGALVRAFGLPDDASTQASVHLPLADFRAFSDAAERSLRDPHWGLHLATQSARGSYDVLEFVARHAATVGDALERIARYWPLLNDLVEVSLERTPDGVAWVHRIPGEPLVVGRHANEFTIAAMVRLCRELSGQPIVPMRIWFAHPAPADTAPLRAFLGVNRLEFDSGANGLLLPSDAATMIVGEADPALFPVLDRMASEMLPSTPTPRDLLGRLTLHIDATLSKGPPTLTAAARALRLSTRTLQRRLEEVGVSFQQLVDQRRRERAVLALDDPSISASRVAEQLGYADLRAFLRAFRRWTGTTPQAFRRHP